MAQTLSLDPMFKGLVNSMKLGDIDKLTKYLSLIILNSSSKNLVIPSKPLFVESEVTWVEEETIRGVKIKLYYPGWILGFNIRNEDDGVSLRYWIERGSYREG